MTSTPAFHLSNVLFAGSKCALRATQCSFLIAENRATCHVAEFISSQTARVASSKKRVRSATNHVFCSVDQPRNAVAGVSGETESKFDRNAGRVVESCVLVGVDIGARAKASSRLFDIQDSMKELERLAETAGMNVVGVFTQALSSPFPGTYIGTGKVREVRTEMEALGCKTCIFDDELSPAQQRTLENEFGGEERGIKVLDRTALILDIFAQHAATREGQLQVELALYQYRLPRLTRMWSHLERQSGAGGVGLRGPGETQLESDRRMINVRIDKLRKEINLVRQHRSRQRAARRKNAGLPVVALIGYTNAGKSTVLNALTGANVLEADALFATLDPTTRRARLDGLKLSPEILLTDTVGFVQNLPTQLVAAFRATLEEVSEADVLVHVIDASQKWDLIASQIVAVDNVLSQIGADGKPTIMALNKVDLLPSYAFESRQVDFFHEHGRKVSNESVNPGGGPNALRDPEDSGDSSDMSPIDLLVEKIQDYTNCDCVAVSARTGYGVDDVGVLLEDVLREVMVPVEAVVPYTRGDLVSAMHEQGSCEFEEYSPSGTRIVGRAPRPLAARLGKYTVADQATNINRQEALQRDDDVDWKSIARGRH